MNDLHAVATTALRDNGFTDVLDAAAAAELATLHASASSGAAKDLRQLLWSSIDNTESKDLDQIEYAEELPDKGMRLLVGIADVDVLIRKGSALDNHAMLNATSVYTGVEVFPMLPSEVSTGLTSLNEGEDRMVLVVELVLNGDGTARSHDVYRAVATNRAKLAYDSVGAWLEGRGAPPAQIAANPALEAQLWLQDRIASTLKAARQQAGALEFERIALATSSRTS